MIVIPTIKDGADKGTCEGGFLQEPYSPSSSPLLWSLEMYVNDLMDMKRRVEDLKEKGQRDRKRLQEVTITSWELERENKWLKKQVLNLQDDIKRGKQKIITIKQALNEGKVIIENNLKKITKSDTTTKMEEVQATLAGMVLRENKLKEQIKEAKTWAQVVNEPSMEQKEVIQK